MISWHLAHMMGEHKLRICRRCQRDGTQPCYGNVALQRNCSKSGFGHDRKICLLFGCAAGDLFEFQVSNQSKENLP